MKSKLSYLNLVSGYLLLSTVILAAGLGAKAEEKEFKRLKINFKNSICNQEPSNGKFICTETPANLENELKNELKNDLKINLITEQELSKPLSPLGTYTGLGFGHDNHTGTGPTFSYERQSAGSHEFFPEKGGGIQLIDNSILIDLPKYKSIEKDIFLRRFHFSSIQIILPSSSGYNCKNSNKIPIDEMIKASSSDEHELTCYREILNKPNVNNLLNQNNGDEKFDLNFAAVGFAENKKIPYTVGLHLSLDKTEPIKDFEGKQFNFLKSIHNLFEIAIETLEKQNPLDPDKFGKWRLKADKVPVYRRYTSTSYDLEAMLFNLSFTTTRVNTDIPVEGYYFKTFGKDYLGSYIKVCVANISISYDANSNSSIHPPRTIMILRLYGTDNKSQSCGSGFSRKADKSADLTFKLIQDSQGKLEFSGILEDVLRWDSERYPNGDSSLKGSFEFNNY